MNPCDYYQPDEEICSLQHVYKSILWLRPRSPAHQRGPSMLTEAHRHIMLTAAYRQTRGLSYGNFGRRCMVMGWDRVRNGSWRIGRARRASRGSFAQLPVHSSNSLIPA
ncbi:hypothetical protein F2Q69_00051969 [Brassica cretica]|uniref:Uncharacterized protein n=1 Tax=Brassica cretica TaxID=69181 RepID=A0A8S9MTR8_BRACR|nr:hypothetical protein F2Q69_00051969 [Brassica cretica]